MAIFHCQCQIIKRSEGRSAVAAAAYRAGEKLVDERTGETHDFRPRTRTTDIVAETFLPDGAPETLRDRATLWNQIEKIEKRKNAQVCREFDVALPVELSREEQIALAQEFARSFTETERVAADLCLHFGDSGNPHFHLMTTMRRITEDGINPDKKSDRDLNARELVSSWRLRWEEMANRALLRAGRSEQITRLSHAERGLEERPQIHLGVAAAAMEKRGIQTERGDRLAEIIEEQTVIRETRRRIAALAAIQLMIEKAKAASRKKLAAWRRWRDEQDYRRESRRLLVAVRKTFEAHDWNAYTEACVDFIERDGRSLMAIWNAYPNELALRWYMSQVTHEQRTEIAAEKTRLKVECYVHGSDAYILRGHDGFTRLLRGEDFIGARPQRGEWIDLTWSGLEGEKKIVSIVSAQRLAWEEAKRANLAQAEALRRQLAELETTGRETPGGGRGGRGGHGHGDDSGRGGR